MKLEREIVQAWVAGAELRVEKDHRPFAKLPLVNQIKKVADQRRRYLLSERIDLTRARNFRVQDTAEDFFLAAVELPIFGKRVIGNDVGLAVASFDYTDSEGAEHNLIAICAYSVRGVIRKQRELEKVMIVTVA